MNNKIIYLDIFVLYYIKHNIFLHIKNCKLIISNIPVFKEIASKQAIYFNPFSYEDIAYTILSEIERFPPTSVFYLDFKLGRKNVVSQ